MQLIVLGMHRSGTSALARLLNMMGAYAGPEWARMGATKANPEGYWERQDVMQLNEFVLHSAGCYWDKITEFKIRELPSAVLDEFKIRASSIVLEMDAHRPWMLKEPRLCLLFELWKEQLEEPVCIHIYRNPLEVAQSLLTRDGIPIHVGIALWEKYNLSAVKASRGLPRLTVSHNDLMNTPEIELKYIYEQLIGFDVDGLHMPSKREITSFIRKDLYREIVNEEKLAQHLNGRQLQMFKAFSNGRILTTEKDYQMSEAAKTILEEYEQIQKTILGAKRAREDASKLMTELRNQYAQKEEELNHQIEKQKQAVKNTQSEANKLTDELKDQHAQLEQALSLQIERHVKEAEDVRERIKKKAAGFDKQHMQQNEKLSELTKLMAVLKKELSKIELQKLDLEKELEVCANELGDRGQTIKKLEVKVTSGVQAINDALKLAEDRLRDIKQLVRWLHVVEFHLGSWRWRGGRLALGTFARMIGKAKGGIDADHINKVFANFRSWEYSKDDISTGELAALIIGDKAEKIPDRHVILIQTSGLFDTNWYLKEYPDVKECGMNPIEHYVKIGFKENRNPSPDFDTKSYLQNFPNVAKSGISPLEHYILHGRDER